MSFRADLANYKLNNLSKHLKQMGQCLLCNSSRITFADYIYDSFCHHYLLGTDTVIDEIPFTRSDHFGWQTFTVLFDLHRLVNMRKSMSSINQCATEGQTMADFRQPHSGIAAKDSNSLMKLHVQV